MVDLNELSVTGASVLWLASFTWSITVPAFYASKFKFALIASEEFVFAPSPQSFSPTKYP